MECRATWQPIAVLLEGNNIEYTTVQQYTTPFYFNSIITRIIDSNTVAVWDPRLYLWLTVRSCSNSFYNIDINSNSFYDNSCRGLLSNKDRSRFVSDIAGELNYVGTNEDELEGMPVEPKGNYRQGLLDGDRIADIGGGDISLTIRKGVSLLLASSRRIRGKRNDVSVVEHPEYMDNLLEMLCSNGIISWVRKRPKAVWPLKLVSKGVGVDPRLVVNMSGLKKRMPKYRVEFAGIAEAEKISFPGCWYLKVDWKNGYWHLRMDDRAKRWCGGCWGDRWFVWNVLLFGLPSAPFEFSRLVRVFGEYFRSLGLVVTWDLDDFLFVFQSREDALLWRETIVEVFGSCGVQLNWEKCVLDPVQRIQFFGYLLDSTSCTVGVVESVRNLVGKLASAGMDSYVLNGKQLYSLVGNLGTLRVVSTAVYGKMWNWIQVQRRIGLSGQYQRYYRIDGLGLVGRYLAGNLVERRWNQLWEPVAVVYTDASDSGFGWTGTFGSWGTRWAYGEEMMHIMGRELLAVLFAVAWICRFAKDGVVLLYVDNMAVVSWVRKKYCSYNRWRNSLVLLINQLMLDRNLVIRVEYVESSRYIYLPIYLSLSIYVSIFLSIIAFH